MGLNKPSHLPNLTESFWCDIMICLFKLATHQLWPQIILYCGYSQPSHNQNQTFGFRFQCCRYRKNDLNFNFGFLLSKTFLCSLCPPCQQNSQPPCLQNCHPVCRVPSPPNQKLLLLLSACTTFTLIIAGRKNSTALCSCSSGNHWRQDLILYTQAWLGLNIIHTGLART